VKPLALYHVERDNILENIEKKNAMETVGARYAGEKLEV
jgi:hypothetical protein